MLTLQDKLDQEIAQRPTADELVKKGILDGMLSQSLRDRIIVFPALASSPIMLLGERLC